MANTGDTITFSVNGTIQLLGTSGFGQIAIGKSLTIQGPGSNLLTVRAFDPTRVARIDSDGRRVFLVEDNALFAECHDQRPDADQRRPDGGR